MPDRRAQATRHARQHGRPWTAEEDRVVMAATSDLRAVGARLGRTQTAVEARRQELRKRARRAA